MCWSSDGVFSASASRCAWQSASIRGFCRMPLGLYLGSAAMIMLSRTDSTPMMPVSLRSSVSRAIPASMASFGSLIDRLAR